MVVLSTFLVLLQLWSEGWFYNEIETLQMWLVETLHFPSLGHSSMSVATARSAKPFVAR